MRIAIGCDEAAYTMKESMKKFLLAEGFVVQDFGTHDQEPVLYPDIAIQVGQSIVQGENDRGILLCGTGIGMAISANKVKGIRAAVGHDLLSVQRARRSNDAQVITFGARVIGEHLALELLKIWLKCEFEGGGSTEKVEKIKEFEQLQQV